MPVRPLRLSLRKTLRTLFLGFSMMLACCHLNAQVTFSASQLTFSDTVQGGASPSQSIVLTNHGAAPVLLFSPSFNAGGFGVSRSDCPVGNAAGGGGIMAAGAGCAIQVQFTPYGIGPESATLSIYVTDQAFNFVNQPSVMFSGTGLIPRSSVVLSATSVDFGTQVENQPFAAPKSFTVTSGGPSPLIIGSAGVSGMSIQGVQQEFTNGSDCPSFGGTLPVGNSCTITVNVVPRDGGPRSATLSITDSAPDSPQTVLLRAFGHPLSVGPSSLSFPIQAVNTSGPGAVGLQNNGNKPAKFAGAKITGDFSYIDGCAADFANVIPPNSDCTFFVSFTPRSPGPHTGTLTIFDEDVTSPQVIALSGVGAAAVVSTTSLTYFVQMVGVSRSQTVTLTNVYSKPLAVSGISASGDYNQQNDCGRWLGPNSSCTITVTFSPTDLGQRDGTLLLNEKDPSSPQSVALSGYGIAPIKHVHVHYDYMVLPDQGTACTPRNAHPGDVFSSDCAQSQSCIENVCRGHSHAPDDRAIDTVVEAFRQHGSVLHIDPHHTAIPERTTIEFGQRGFECPNAIDPVNFYDLRDQYYQPSHKFEHYAVFGHYAHNTENADCRSKSGVTGVSELPPFDIGLNFVVALGSFLDAGLPSDTMLRFEAGTFMHELGHNLGLQHGGGLFGFGDDTNYKPNYPSVMNYYNQSGIIQADAVGSEQIKSCTRDKDCGPAALCTQGANSTFPIKFCTRYDYSDQLLPSGGPTPGVLDERGQLSEPAGLGSGRPDLFFYSDGNCLQQMAPSEGPVDWDGDGDTTGTDLTADLDFLWSEIVASGLATCPSGRYVPLQGHNDWGDLLALQERPHSGHSWKSNPEPHRGRELTIEEAKERHFLHPPRPVTIMAQPVCSLSPAINSSVITLWLPASDDLDVTEVDIGSLKLHGISPAKVSVVDVNGDGRPDLELIFPAASLKLHANAKRMTLTGSLKNSQAFWSHVEIVCNKTNHD